jgi:diguanylate cyclase (GGDEF)-like protein/PAS domain S-box-containing protein
MEQLATISEKSKQGHILVVDDDIKLIDLLQSGLKSEGYYCETSMDAASALELINENSYDIMITDIVMPDMNGLELTKKVKRIKPDIKVLIMTGFNNFSYDEAIEADASDFIKKPFSLKELTVRIKHIKMQEELHRSKKELEKRVKQLEESEERFRAIFDNALDGILVADVETKKFYSGNSMMCRMLGYSEEEIKYLGVRDIHPEEDLPFVTELFEKQVWREKKLAKDIPIKRDDGSVFYADINSFPITLSDKTFLVGIFRDITERRRSENLLQESEEKYRRIVETAEEGIWTIDAEGNTTFVNKKMAEMLGYSADEMAGMHLFTFMDEEWKATAYVNMEHRRKGIFEQHEFRFLRKDGTYMYALLSTNPLYDSNGNYIGALAMVTDITERKKAEDRIEHLAYYDALTGLTNRNLFIDRLTQGIARAEYSKKVVAVIVVDIDRFKSINDAYGLDAGDAVLQEVAKRLLSSVRDGDTIARLGNDDFGVLLIDIADSADIILVIEKIMKKVSRPIQFDGKEIMLTLSAGISVYPYDGKDASSHIKNADLALAKAKQQGRKNYQFYTQDMDVKATEFVLMEKNLFNAMQNEEFILHYQPYWDINTKKILGMEALIRWISPELGLVSPGNFIHILEDTRMIMEVGEWILRTAIRQVKEWQRKGLTVVPISVNLSLIQFRQKDLSGMIEGIIRKEGLSPSFLTLEITESAFMQDTGLTYSLLKSLKDIGVSLSIDDFGTGYSSLAHLKRFPIDNLKIDMSFTREIAADPDTASIVTAIIAMAHTLNLKTIAEGIETQEQWKILRLLRCDMGQGYYFSKPLPAEEIERLFLGGTTEQKAKT